MLTKSEQLALKNLVQIVISGTCVYLLTGELYERAKGKKMSPNSKMSSFANSSQQQGSVVFKSDNSCDN